MAGITICAAEGRDVPGSLIGIATGALAALAAFVPPGQSQNRQLDAMSSDNHQAKQDLAGAMNALALKIERILAIAEVKPPA